MKTIKGIIAIFSVTILLAAAAFSQTVLTGLDGSRVDVQGQRGKIVVLAIGASWLPLSGKQAEYANTIATRYKGRDVVVYFVTTDSTNAKSKNFATDEALKSFATTAKIGVQVLRDADGAATLRKLNIDQVPSFIILDKTGAVSGQPFGGIDPKYDVTVPISKAIDKLLT